MMNIKKLFCFVSTLLLSPCCLANSQAHVHGEGMLLIAQENKQWQMEFVLPAADLLGFEHLPENKDQQNRVNSLIENIENIQNVIKLPAQCEHKQTKHSLNELAKTNIHAHKGQRSHEHDHSNKHDHSHEHDHLQKHDHSHEHDDSHDHEHESHLDITFSYLFECPTQLNAFELTLFSIAPSLATVNAQWISNESQGAIKLSSDSATLTF